MVMADEIELYMKGKITEEDIRIEIAVGTLQEDMRIHNGIETREDTMNGHLITTNHVIEDTNRNIIIGNGLDNAILGYNTPLVIGHYHLNDFMNPLAPEIVHLPQNRHHDALALQLHHQRNYNSHLEQNLLRIH